MRRIFKLYIIILILVFPAACVDLQEEPIGILAPEGYFESEKDIMTAINGCYGSMASTNYYGSNYVFSLQLGSDMVDVGLDFASGYADYNRFTVEATNPYPLYFWQCAFGVISIANTALDAIDQIDETQAVKDKLEAEARFIKGLVYYDLVREFGEVPYLKDLNFDVNEVKKSSVDAIYEGIISDLEFALNIYPCNIRTEVGVQDLLKALLPRYWLQSNSPEGTGKRHIIKLSG